MIRGGCSDAAMRGWRKYLYGKLRQNLRKLGQCALDSSRASIVARSPETSHVRSLGVAAWGRLRILLAAHPANYVVQLLSLQIQLHPAQHRRRSIALLRDCSCPNLYGTFKPVAVAANASDMLWRTHSGKRHRCQFNMADSWWVCTSVQMPFPDKKRTSSEQALAALRRKVL